MKNKYNILSILSYCVLSRVYRVQGTLIKKRFHGFYDKAYQSRRMFSDMAHPIDRIPKMSEAQSRFNRNRTSGLLVLPGDFNKTGISQVQHLLRG